MTRNPVGRILVLPALAGAFLLPSVLSATPMPGDPQYTITEIPALAPSYPVIYAMAISSSGRVAGVSYVRVEGGAYSRAFVQLGQGSQDLGTLPGTSYSAALGINAAGEVVGYSGSRALLYADRNSDGIKELIDLLGTSGMANAINDAGRIVGMMGNHAFYLDSSSSSAVPVDLFPQTPMYSTATAVSPGGSITGFRYEQSGDKGWVYAGGTLTPLPSEGMFRPAAINDSLVVVGNANFGSGLRAARHDGQTLADLGTLGGWSSEAKGINASGHVVGKADTAGGRTHAFLHDGVVMHDLNDFIDPEGGWEIVEANAINDVGQIAAGGYRDGVPFLRALLLSPHYPPTVSLGGPYSVDEGSSLTLTASASDPEGTSLTYHWDLDGNGTYETLDEDDVVVLAPAGEDGPSSRTVGVRVTNEGGLSATAAALITIENIAPTAVLTAAPQTLHVNGTATLTFTSQFDPGAADVAAGFSYSYDCNGDEVFDAPASAATSYDCVYPSGGTYHALGRIEDKDGGSRVYPVTVNVLTPQQDVVSLVQLVQSLGLPQGIETSFVVKLEHALAALDAGNVGAACAELQAFINHAQAQSGKKLTVEQADQIIAAAQAIRLVLGCS